MLLGPRLYLFLLLLLPLEGAVAQSQNGNAAQIKQRMERLGVLGTVLYFAAHPDDENTLLLSWLANEKHYRTAYLSLTRGDGGQNLIGTEQGVELGMIRTHEMLAARAIDGAEQFFTAAYDFGFSKTHEETFQFWNKEETLREAVYIIRKFKPDVIINRFPPDRRGGHGHHQASAILSREAFHAAADPNRFPEQLKEVSVWQAKRLLWNTANFGGQNNTSEDQLKVEVGHYSPLLGISYGEMAAKSRSMHKSQGFGAASRRGHLIEYFEHVAGQEASETLMDGIRTDWSRLGTPLAHTIQQRIDALNTSYDLNHPHKSIPALIALHKEVSQIADEYWRKQKTKEIEELIAACAGIHIENYTDHPSFAIGEPVEVKQELIVRNPDLDVALLRIEEKEINQIIAFNRIFRHGYTRQFHKTTQPYWLERTKEPGKFDVRDDDFGHPVNRDAPHTTIAISINGFPIELNVPIKHKFVDPVRGEVHDDIQIIPELSGNISQDLLIMHDDSPLTFSVTFEGKPGNGPYNIEVTCPGQFEVSPSSVELDFSTGQTITQNFLLKPTGAGLEESALLSFLVNGKPLKQRKVIRYEHIPTLSWFPPLQIRVQQLQMQSSVKRVGYVQGAGDKIPEALLTIGIQVDLLSPNQLGSLSLEKYDALVFGVRAFNVHPILAQKMGDVLRYAENGGVVVVQYNVNSGLGTSELGPYPFHLSRTRVTEETSPVTLRERDPVLQHPNVITERDFEGWVQERGLYFVENADGRYRQPLAMNDKGEQPHSGSLLVTNYGSGKFVYTSLSFFRQLPAGVPGAYRLFLNLLHKEK